MRFQADESLEKRDSVLRTKFVVRCVTSLHIVLTESSSVASGVVAPAEAQHVLVMHDRATADNIAFAQAAAYYKRELPPTPRSSIIDESPPHRDDGSAAGDGQENTLVEQTAGPGRDSPRSQHPKRSTANPLKRGNAEVNDDARADSNTYPTGRNAFDRSANNITATRPFIAPGKISRASSESVTTVKALNSEISSQQKRTGSQDLGESSQNSESDDGDDFLTAEELAAFASDELPVATSPSKIAVLRDSAVIPKSHVLLQDNRRPRVDSLRMRTTPPGLSTDTNRKSVAGGLVQPSISPDPPYSKFAERKAHTSLNRNSTRFPIKLTSSLPSPVAPPPNVPLPPPPENGFVKEAQPLPQQWLARQASRSHPRSPSRSPNPYPVSVHTDSGQRKIFLTLGETGFDDEPELPSEDIQIVIKFKGCKRVKAISDKHGG